MKLDVGSGVRLKHGLLKVEINKLRGQGARAKPLNEGLLPVNFVGTHPVAKLLVFVVLGDTGATACKRGLLKGGEWR